MQKRDNVRQGINFVNVNNNININVTNTACESIFTKLFSAIRAWLLRKS